MRHPEIGRSRSGAALGRWRTSTGAEPARRIACTDGAARALGFDNPDFRYFRAIQLQFNGRVAEAEAELEACLKLGPTFGRASLTLARLRKWTNDDNHLEFIRRRLETVEQGTEDHAAFEFAQYKELEDLGRYEEAWAALQRANAVMHERLKHHVQDEEELFDAVIARCDGEFTRMPAHRFDGPMPIFIVGMPRSGTTSARAHPRQPFAGDAGGRAGRFLQAMALGGRPARPQIAGCGHGRSGPRDRFRRSRAPLPGQTQWRAGGRPYYVDKLPPNFMLAGFIRRALPQAKIVHMGREPMDLCFSNYRALFGDAFAYSYDLDALAAHYRQYRRLMGHWHAVMPGAIHDVDYAALVQDTEAATRALLGTAGCRSRPVAWIRPAIPRRSRRSAAPRCASRSMAGH